MIGNGDPRDLLKNRERRGSIGATPPGAIGLGFAGKPWIILKVRGFDPLFEHC